MDTKNGSSYESELTNSTMLRFLQPGHVLTKKSDGSFSVPKHWLKLYFSIEERKLTVIDVKKVLPCTMQASAKLYDVDAEFSSYQYRVGVAQSGNLTPICVSIASRHAINHLSKYATFT
jgi:hypothetical protein